MDLNSILTFSEAADKWGFHDGNTLRKAVERKRFQEDEIRKSGNVWLTTYDAMIRVFGEPEHIGYHISYADIIEIATACYKQHLDFLVETKSIYEKARCELRKGNAVSLIERASRPHIIVRIFTSVDELDVWLVYLAKRINK